MKTKNLNILLMSIANVALALAAEEKPKKVEPNSEFNNISNKFTYLVYPILLIVLFWGAKFFGTKTWNDGAFSLKQMKNIQGFIAVCIMFHHIGQKTCASWLSEEQFVAHGLNFFVPIGYYFVSIFLFCSGYGLYYSFHKKENYLSNGFFKRRVFPVVLSYYTTGWLYIPARFLMHEEIDVSKFFIYFFGLKLSNPHAWFVVVLPFLYLFFYLSFRYIKKDGLAIASIFLVIILYCWFGAAVAHNDWLVCGEWWWESVPCFGFGILFAKYCQKVVEHFKKHNILYYVYMFVLFFAMLGSYQLSEVAKDKVGYYGEYDDKGYIVTRRLITLLTEVLACTTFVFFVFFLGMKVQFGNRFIAFMGTITLEFYLIHGFFLEPFAHTFAGVTPPIYHVKNVPLLILIVFIPAIPAAILLQKLHKWICAMLFNKSTPKKTGEENNDLLVKEKKEEKEAKEEAKEESEKMMVELVIDDDSSSKKSKN